MADATTSATGPGCSIGTKVRAPGILVREAFGKASASRATAPRNNVT